MKRKTNADKSAADNLEHEPAKLRQKHLKKARQLKRLLYGVIVLVIVALGLTSWSWYSQAHKSSTAGIDYLRKALGATTTTAKLQTIRSTVGFNVTYDTSLVKAQASVYSEITTDPSLYSSGNGPIDLYNGNDLNTSRAYGTIDFSTVDSEQHYSLTYDLNPVYQMELSTDLQANIFAQGHKLYPKDSDMDIAVKLFTPQTQTSSYATVVPSLTSQTSVKIGNIAYQKVVYKMADTTFKAASYSEVQYVTVQNGRPYVIRQDISPTTTAGDIALLNQVITNITYTKPDPHTLIGASTTSAAWSKSTPPVETAAATTTPLPDNSIHLPGQLSDQSLKIVAENQPGVVRVGTIVCFNFNLLLPNGQTASTITNACAGGSGSGSIVSNNGYISTNGHVVIMGPQAAFELYIEESVNEGNAQALQAYVQYLVDSGVATASQVNALITAIQGGDNDAAQTLLDLTSSIPASDFQITSKQSSYAIQLSNDPIKYQTQGTKLSFTYSNNVVPAKYVDSNYEALSGDSVNFSTYSGSDVALLKMGGSDFPVISLGNLSDVQDGSTVTAVGWPGFEDGGLDTTDAHTIPTATAGSVTQIGNEPSGPYKVIITTVPIAEGNSGGPAFNNQGQEVGLTTYAVTSADPDAGVTKESTGGILRNIDDFKALLTKNKVTLSTTSQVTSLWDRVINDFAIGHFKDAVKITQEVAKLYPQNYLAGSFLSSAKQQVAEGHDTSGAGAATVLVGVLSIVLIIGAGVVAIIFFKHHRHGQRMGYYAAGGGPSVPSVSPYQAAPIASLGTPAGSPFGQPQPTPAAPPQPAPSAAVPTAGYSAPASQPAAPAAPPPAPASAAPESAPLMEPVIIRPTVSPDSPSDPPPAAPQQ